MYRAKDHAYFLENAPRAWGRDLKTRALEARRIERMLNPDAPPGPIHVPTVEAAGVKDGVPWVKIDGVPHPAEVLPPDHFSPAARYRRALEQDPEARKLHEELEGLVGKGNPRVRRSKRSGLPIVLDKRGNPLKLEDTEGYLPIWDPPRARKILRELG